jgi:hypothetical protein
VNAARPDSTIKWRLLRWLTPPRNGIQVIKTKITAHAVIPVFGENQVLGSDFAHRLDALGAQNLVNLVTLFHDNRFLQVGSESTIGGALGK